MRLLPAFHRYRAACLAGPLLSAAALATAQTVPDSTRLSYGEEVQTAPAAVPARVQADERSILKLGLNNFTFEASSLDNPANYYSRYGVHLAYERKLASPAWSVLGELSPAVTNSRSVAGEEIRTRFALRTQVAGRYYYNLARRLRLGRSTGSFSANYLTATLGAGVGRQARESALYQIAPNGRLLHPDAALAYGLQRRLGRHGFIDANVGISTLFGPRDTYFSVEPHLSLRVGLVLGDAPAASVASLRPVVDSDDAQRPKAYVGVQLGSYNYQLHHSDIPYPAGSYGQAGNGTYSREIKSPYYYVGYYLRPRLAVQVGVQEQLSVISSSSELNGVLVNASTTREQELAVPVLLRFTLTRPFLRRVQFDALGGLAVVRSAVRYQEQRLGGQPASFDFERKTVDAYAVLGFEAAYGIGRRRRVQATADLLFTNNLGRNPSVAKTVEVGSGIGLRYRFGY